jgi:hypothetical protein
VTAAETLPIYGTVSRRVTAAKPRASRALTPRPLKAGDGVRMSSRNANHGSHLPTGSMQNAAATANLSIKAEKAVGRLSRVTEQGTVHRWDRMGGALWAMGWAAMGDKSPWVLPEGGKGWGSARACLLRIFAQTDS